MRKMLLFTMLILGLSSISHAAYSSPFTEIARSTSGVSSLSDIRTLVREDILDPENSYGTNRYTDEELNRYINIVHEDIAIQTQCLHARATGQLTAGVTYYYLPQNYISVERIIFKEDTVLPFSNPYDLDQTAPSWFDSNTSSPTAYYRFPGSEQIGFYPTPKYSGGAIDLRYVKRPTTLTDDTDEIFDSIPILNSFRRSIVVGVAYIIFLQENDSRSQSKFQEYNQYIELIKRYYNMNPTYKYNARTFKK